MKSIAVCGLGKLGLPIAAVFSASDLLVTGFDVDSAKVRMVNDKTLGVSEPDVSDYMQLPALDRNFHATDVPAEAVANSEACLFVTPTPSVSDGGFDHHYLLNAVSLIAQEAGRQKKNGYLFIINSTVMPGVCLWEIEPILNRFMRGLYPALAYKPEFIALGTVIRDLHYPNVLLIGASSAETADRVESLYGQMLLGNPEVHRMELVDAEFAKISLNCAVTMKISFANQVGMIAEKLGASPHRVLAAVGADPRVGKLALIPGLPFAGPCYPRDNRMFQRVAATVGEQAPLSIATDVVNKNVLRKIYDRIAATKGEVGILGLAYKPGTLVIEESAGTRLRDLLRAAGRKVKTHDVLAPHSHEIEDVVKCPTVVIACPWPEYKNLQISKEVYVVDPMNCIQVETLAVEVASGA